MGEGDLDWGSNVIEEMSAWLQSSKIPPDEGFRAKSKERDSIFCKCKHGQRNLSVDRLDGRLKIESQ